MHTLLTLPIIDGPLPWVLGGLSVVLLLVLAVRPGGARERARAFAAAAAGALLALAVYLVVNATGAFGDALPGFVLWSAMAAFGAIGLAIASFRRSRWWRKVVAGVAVAVFAASGVVAVNAGFGINPTLGSLFGVVPVDTIALPPSDAGDDPPDQPLYETWHAPADMPATGRVGTAEIPATVSGFDARPAGIYLPPAALVADAPALPVIIFMMGQPGNPDPSFLAATLDAYAAQHDGLAPIAVVADQVGANVVDTACADSTSYGNAETYITKDVVTWVKAHLHVIDDPRWWVIGGYSNGGGCAITFAAEHPELWKNVMDISGEPYPGSEQPDNIEKTVYGGSTQAFEASKPVNILAAHPGAYDGMTAAFTAGGDDPTYVTAAQTVSAAAQRAGMSVSLDIIPGAGHTGDALTSGLQITVGKMYPALGLSPG